MASQSLPELQADFIGSVFADGPSPSYFVPPGRTRFSIYRAAVLTNLGEALRAIYPVVDRLTGKEFFDYAARRFIRDCPSASGDLHRYGERFPEFLSSFETAVSLPYLGDVARLEWLWHEAFHAADHTALDLGRLAAIPQKRWSRLRLTLQPGCRLLRSPYPVQRIWQVNQPGYAGDVTVSLDEGEARVLISRAGYEVAVAAVRAGEYAFLEAAASGLELSRAVEAALAQDPALDVAALLRDLAAREIVVDFQ
jgi:hypothetical protein